MTARTQSPSVTRPDGQPVPTASAGPTSNSLISHRPKLHYVDWGNRGAPPLLLVHGGRDHVVGRVLEADLQGRQDLTKDTIITIDPGDARDFDDAISLTRSQDGHWHLGVHIADVAHFVPRGGPLDNEARRRGTSVYLPRHVIPMLPEILSADVCSLKAGQDRAAMVCHLKISPDGELLKWRFTRAVVRLAENVAYEEAQRRIDTGEADESLGNLWKAWGRLWKAREARDPLDLDLPERRHGLYRARGEGRTLIDMKLEEFPADMTPATRGYDGVSGVLGLGEPIVGGIAIRL